MFKLREYEGKDHLEISIPFPRFFKQIYKVFSFIFEAGLEIVFFCIDITLSFFEKKLIWGSLLAFMAAIIYGAFSIFNTYDFDRPKVNQNGQIIRSDDLQIKKQLLQAEIKVKVDKLAIELKTTKETDYYKVSPAVTTEVIKDNIGSYFYVNIIDPLSKKQIAFLPGKYVLNEMDQQFGQALGKFQQEVMNLAYQGGAKIYIRGMADTLDSKFNKPFISDIPCAGKKFADITYHPSAPRGEKYIFNSLQISKLIADYYGNNDLPELRARYLQCKYMELFPEVPTFIIQGEIDATIDKMKRNATMILFIPSKLNDKNEMI